MTQAHYDTQVINVFFSVANTSSGRTCPGGGMLEALHNTIGFDLLGKIHGPKKREAILVHGITSP